MGAELCPSEVLMELGNQILFISPIKIWTHIGFGYIMSSANEILQSGITVPRSTLCNYLHTPYPTSHPAGHMFPGHMFPDTC